MILDKITQLNQTVLECLGETSEIKIVKAFTEAGLQVLHADFGFVWLNSAKSHALELVYKSPNLPYMPVVPREEGRNYRVLEFSTPDFVTDVKKRMDKYDVSSYMKSFVIIPLVYKQAVYGTMVLCFKKSESFSKEKRILSVFIGNSIAQTVTIRRLAINEQEARILSEKRELLLNEEKVKTEFIANTTHEFRTPLAIIKGNIDLVLINDSKGVKSVKNTLDAINHEVEYLSNILADLELLTSERGSVKNRIVSKEVNMADLISRIIKRCQAIAHKKNISIKAKNIPRIILMGDTVYLEKAFLNLIRNAVIYGREGGWIKIDAVKIGRSVEIKIKDNGIGIDEEDLPRIFDRFYRADKSHNRSSKNTGLGLAIVKWAVNLHGGNVSVKSHKNKGSTFNVILPILKQG